MIAENPLLSFRYDVPFDTIGPEHVEPAVRSLLVQAEADLTALGAAAGPRTRENTLDSLDRLTERLEYAMAIIGHLEAVATTTALRDAYNAVQPLVSAFYAQIPLRRDLWNALLDYSGSDDAANLDAAHARYLRETIADFRRHGAELAPEKKSRLEQISVELAKLTTRYSQNVLDATNEFDEVVRDEARLSGLPQSALEAARESAKSKGLTHGYRFTLQQPSYIAVLSYADDASLREKLYRAHNTRATSGRYDNRALMVDILRLRREKASVLGFASFADLVLEDRMAKTGAAAAKFIDALRGRTLGHFERENRELFEFRKSLEGEAAPALAPWDIAYYAEKLRRERFDFDEEGLRPYFSVDRVLGGMFEVVRRIYGIVVERADDIPRYHDEVRYYRVRDEAGTEIGGFYADLYPRESKRGGAWMADFITGMPGATHTRHLGVMCANSNPPSGGKPALLTHRDVETLFHEFGHLLHHLLGRPHVRGLAGTRVAWDFVELPSMIMENFCWERSVLDLFAQHYETGARIPQDLLDKLLRSRTFRAANAQMRQLGFASADLALHIDYDPARDGDGDGDVIAFARNVAQAHSSAQLPDDYAMIAGFGHLFASPVGYAAGYYSYKWAEALEADAFSRFKNADVLSREVGEEFRDKVLSRGNEADPMELYKAFMGREPSVEPMMQRAGLV